MISFFFFQSGYSSPTQSAITAELGLTVSEVGLKFAPSIAFRFISVWLLTLVLRSVLFVWFSIKCGCNGWGNS